MYSICLEGKSIFNSSDYDLVLSVYESITGGTAFEIPVGDKFDVISNKDFIKSNLGREILLCRGGISDSLISGIVSDGSVKDCSKKEILISYLPSFKSMVLDHLKYGISQEEYLSLRELAGYGQRWCDDDSVEERLSLLTKEQVVEEYSCSDSLPVGLVIKGLGAQISEIGKIDGYPCFYISGMGIYIWGKDHENGLSLSLWLSSPAYPPGW